MKTKIYRYQHKVHNVGPMSNMTLELFPNFPRWDVLFNHHDAVQEVDGDHFEANFPLGIWEHHRFGCTTLERLFELTKSSAFDTLAEFGFDIFEFESDDAVVFPDGQVVFDSRTARKIS